MGQSNLAAGSTIGSNHNSRSADGEIIAGRGFWPGLCVSLKHNSIFSSFTIIAKGDYSTELNIKIPFSLVSNNLSDDKLMIMPAYWFMYNMYALERNAWKFADRDKRKHKIQHLENNYLAPDTIHEILESLTLLEELAGSSWHKTNNLKNNNRATNIEKGKELFKEENSFCTNLEIDGGVFENSKRSTVLLKTQNAYNTFKEIIEYYFILVFLEYIEQENVETLDSVIKIQPQVYSKEWLNIGGQLMLKVDVENLKQKIKTSKLKSWDAVHEFYKSTNEKYCKDKLEHALLCLQQIASFEKIDVEVLSSLLDQSIKTKKWMVKNIETSRQKDYSNEFRKMVYDNDEEMKQVLGNVDDNSFIKEQKKQLKLFIEKVEQVKIKFKI